MQSTRRQLLTGLGALVLAPGAGPAAPPTPLRDILDQAAAARGPAAMLAVLRAASRAGLDRFDRSVLRMVTRGLEREVELRRLFPFGKADLGSPYVVSQRHGAWLQLHEPGDKARQLDEETGRLRADAALGVSPPDFILDQVIRAERALLSGAAPDARAALGRQIETLERLRAPGAAAPGGGGLPRGEEYYRLRLRCASGLDAAPAEIERRVAAETANLLGRADDLLSRLGLGEGSVGARLRALKRRPEYLYRNDDSGRSRAVAEMNQALARLRPRLPSVFNPPIEIGSSVRRMSPADEGAARRGYRDPATPAGPGAYYPDLSAVDERPAWTLTTVAFHETIPGHLLQLGRQRLADPHPLQLRHAPGYAEGWAIYAENLAAAMGVMTPVEELGFIQSFLFRLARVTADIGLHLRRWDRARALRYLKETVGFELFFPFAVEVDRYAAEPAGFAGDAMVALELRRLRPERDARLRAFHDSVLNRGPLSAEAIAGNGRV